MRYYMKCVQCVIFILVKLSKACRVPGRARPLQPCSEGNEEIDRDLQLNYQYANWLNTSYDVHQPDNTGGVEDCVEIYSVIYRGRFGYWNDIPCSFKKGALCELPAFQCFKDGFIFGSFCLLRTHPFLAILVK